MQPGTAMLGLALAALVAEPARAQILSNPTQWYIDTQMYSTRVFTDMVANSMITGRTGTRAKASAPNAPAAADPTQFREAASASMARTLAVRTRGSVEQRDETRRLLDSYVALYKQTAETDGFPSNDLAYAFEYFVVNNYHIYHDLMSVPYGKDPRAKRGVDGFDRIRIMNEKKLLQITMPQERAIYEQFRASLGANPEVGRMTDVQKQETAEQMAIMFGVNYAAYMRAIDAGSDQAVEQAHQMARQGLEKLLGVPVTSIRVTSAGLER
ncbi:MAG: DUF6683 family protein [Gemmatimonadaceae bacterium]